MATEFDEWAKGYPLAPTWSGTAMDFGRAAFAAGRSAGLDAAAEACKGEERLFAESVKRCERIGNLDGSAMDAGGQGACMQIRKRILSLKEQHESPVPKR